MIDPVLVVRVMQWPASAYWSKHVIEIAKPDRKAGVVVFLYPWHFKR